MAIESLVAEGLGQSISAVERAGDEHEGNAVESNGLNNVLNANTKVARLTVWSWASFLQKADSYGAICEDGSRPGLRIANFLAELRA